MSALRCLKVVLRASAFLLMTYTPVWAATITIAPTSSTSVHNCYPFGGGAPGWPPFAGFIYQNIPAFILKTGDTLAFDLGAQTVENIQLQIDMAPTTVNGGDIPSGTFTTLVTNTQTPANPTGDTIIGNFELRFTSQANFNFPGGGLIIRFSNPSAAYQLDNSCSQVLVSADSSDTSGYFVKRFYNDADGFTPYDSSGTDAIGGFQVEATGTAAVATPIPTLSEWGMIILSSLLAAGAIITLRRQRL